MTAISPYAPLRRQSSLLSNSGNHGGRTLRRSSSTGAVVANGGAATLFWIFLRFWRRMVSGHSPHADGGIRESLNAMMEIVSSNLTVHGPCEKNSAESSSTPPRRRRGISAMLRWLVTIVGGDQSKMGRIVVTIVGFTREAFLRSFSAACVVLTGTPTPSHLEAGNSNSSIKNSLTRSVSSRGEGIASSEETNIDAMELDRQQIDQILNYWFGQASPDRAQKSIWMIASSSEELLNRVDDDISDKFRSLIFNLTWNVDDENVDMPLLVRGKLRRWTENVEMFGWQGKMAAIIALDQMTRHIHRHDKKHHDECIQPIPKQEQLDTIAYNVAKKLQSEHPKELSMGMIPLPMRIFGIMPLRHASTIQDLGIVQKDVEAASSLHDEMDRMIRRFRKATNRRMAALQDEARREGKLGLPEEDTKQSVGEISERQFDDEMILECFPFKADMSKARDHVVIKTMSDFLCRMNILQVSDARLKRSRKTTKPFRNNAHTPSMTTTTSCEVPNAIVSLSGGVDSMVIASALAYLRDAEASHRNARPDKILRIIAIHIDYANRPESGAEAAYIGRYCQEIGAEFVCRKINEVTRGVTARDDYERRAREIRFGLYRRCCAEASCGTTESGIGIMLGHHRGDLRENVISNAHKGCGPLDLSGMTAVSRNDGVTLFRPFLSIEKRHIHDYSHTYGVPYFKDTTPHWSTRGKLRNRLLPLLEEIYGEGSLNNLSSLAEESDDAKALIQQTVMGPFMEQVKRYPMGITFETSQWKDFGSFFWKFVLQQVLHSAGLGMFSDKSVESFLNRVRPSNIKEGWIQCRKDYAVFLQKNGRVFVFYPRSFPYGNGQEKDHYNENYVFLGCGSESTMKDGPWTITSEIVKAASENEANSFLQTKALRNMEELMAGDIQYFMKVPIVAEASLPCRLVTVKGFTKQTRPEAWKGFDLKVESALPLLEVDQSVLNRDMFLCDEQYERSWELVKVRLLLNSNQSEA